MTPRNTKRMSHMTTIIGTSLSKTLLAVALIASPSWSLFAETTEVTTPVYQYKGLDTLLISSNILQETPNTISVSIRVDDSSVNEYSRIVSCKNQWDDAEGWELEYHPVNGTLSFIGAYGDMVRASYVHFKDSLWHNITIARDNNVTSLYIDNILVSQGVVEVLPPIIDGVIGSHPTGYLKFGGAVGSVSLYKESIKPIADQKLLHVWTYDALLKSWIDPIGSKNIDASTTVSFNDNGISHARISSNIPWTSYSSDPILDIGGSVTIAATVSLNAKSGSHLRIFSNKEYWNNTNGIELEYDVDSKTLFFLLSDDLRIQASCDLTDEKEHLIVASWSADKQQGLFMVDGKELSTVQYGSSSQYNTAIPSYIKSRIGDTAVGDWSRWEGTIGKIALWSGIPAYVHVVSVMSQPQPQELSDGLLVKGFTGNWKKFPDTKLLNPINVGVSLNPSALDLPTTSNSYALQYTGWIVVPESKSYTFSLTSDDGSLLFINGKEVINNDGTHGVKTVKNSIDLTQGLHRVVLNYFQATGSRQFSVGWDHPTPIVWKSSNSEINGVKSLVFNQIEIVNSEKIIKNDSPLAQSFTSGLYGKIALGNEPWKNIPSENSVTWIDDARGAPSPMFSTQSTLINYTINWKGYVLIPETGSYTVALNSDDGSLLKLNGDILINNNGTHGDKLIKTQKILSKGYHKVDLSYFQAGGQKSLNLKFINDKGIDVATWFNDENSIVPLISTSIPVVEEGLLAKWFAGSWTKLPDFTTLSETGSLLSSNISLSKSLPLTNFGLNYQGFVKIPDNGLYTFTLGSDDGSKLFIDNVPLINNDGTHALKYLSGRMYLSAGYHAINLQYFQATGGKNLILKLNKDGVNIPLQFATKIDGTNG